MTAVPGNAPIHRTVLLTAAVLAAAGVAFWLALRPPAPPVPPGPPGPPPSRGASGDAATSERAALEGRRAPSLPRAAARGGRSSIVGTVRRDGRPASAAVVVERVGRDRGATGAFGRSYVPSLDAAWLAAEPVTTIAAGADGRFRVEGLASNYYRVVATTPEGARGATAVDLEPEGLFLQADLDVVDGVSLRGRAVRADGTPWRGLVAAGDAVPVATDREGRFTLAGLPAGELSLSAVEDGVFSVAPARVTVPFEGEYVLRIDAGLEPLRGVVTTALGGSPVAGAEVVAYSSGNGVQGAVAKTRTDEMGAFTLPVADSGSLTVFAEGFEQGLKKFGTGEREIRVVLGKGAAISGRVTTAEGARPLPGVRVSASTHSAPPASDLWTDLWTTGAVVTDANGEFEAHDLPVGDAVVFVCDAGWTSSEAGRIATTGAPSRWVRLVPGGRERVDLAVAPAASARGRVLDSQLAPIAGAKVDVKVEVERKGQRFSPIDVEPVATGSDGSFAVDSLEPGVRYLFTGSAPGRSPATSEPVEAVAGRPADIQLVLPASRRLVAVVVDARTDRPVPGAALEASVVGAAGVRDLAGAVERKTGVDGRAEFKDLPSGRLGVHVEADGYVRPGTFGFVFVPDSEGAAADLSVRISIEPESVIEGKVLLPGGAPAKGASLRVRRVGAEYEYPFLARFSTAEEGTFRVPGLAQGEYVLDATFERDGERLMARATARAGASDVVLTLGNAASMGRVEVRVVDAKGAPVARARVAIDLVPGTRFGDVRGGYALFDAPLAEQGWAWVWMPAGADGSPLPLAAARVRIPVSGPVVVTLDAEQTVEGRVLDPRGEGVAGAEVRASAVEAGSRDLITFLHDIHATERTDERGAFRLGRLAAGLYRVDVLPPKGFAVPAPLRVESGTKDVEIRLAESARAEVSVVDPEGRPITGALVAAYQRTRADPMTVDRMEEELEGRYATPHLGGAARTGPDGRASIEGLHAGTTYRLAVRPPPSRLDLLALDEGGWTAAERTVRLAQGFVVRGVVRDRTGNPVAGAGVSHRESDQKAETAADGSFTLGHLPAREVDLYVTEGLYVETRYEDRRHVVAGGPDVVLEIDLGLELVVEIEDWHERQDLAKLTPLSGPGSRGAKEINMAVGDDGVVRFRGLRQAVTYALFVGPFGDGTSVYRTDVRADVPRLRAKRVLGRRLAGKIVLPPGDRPATVYVEGPGLFLTATPDAQGAFEVRGVPEGEWEVTTSTDGDGDSHHARLRARAGDTEVVLRPK